MKKSLSLCDNCQCAVSNWLCIDCQTEAGKSNEFTSFFNFCTDCAELHKKLRQYKQHQLKNIITTSQIDDIQCCNCEENSVKFYCKDCSEENRYLCLGCSILHPKIKSFRNHTVLVIHNQFNQMIPNSIVRSPISSMIKPPNITGIMNEFKNVLESFLPIATPPHPAEERPFPSHSDQMDLFSRFQGTLLNIQLYLLQLVEEVRSSPWTSSRFWKSSSVLLTGVCSYFLFIKYLFGRSSTSIHLLMVMGFIISNSFAQSRQKQKEKLIFGENHQNIERLVKPQTKTSNILNSLGGRGTSIVAIGSSVNNQVLQKFAEEFPDEFSYEKPPSGGQGRQEEVLTDGGYASLPKRVTLRPRTRPYVPRKRISKDLPEEVASNGERPDNS